MGQQWTSEIISSSPLASVVKMVSKEENPTFLRPPMGCCPTPDLPTTLFLISKHFSAQLLCPQWRPEPHLQGKKWVAHTRELINPFSFFRIKTLFAGQILQWKYSHRGQAPICQQLENTVPPSLTICSHGTIQAEFQSQNVLEIGLKLGLPILQSPPPPESSKLIASNSPASWWLRSC